MKISVVDLLAVIDKNWQIIRKIAFRVSVLTRHYEHTHFYFLCLFYFCVNCSAVSPKWFTIDVDAIQKLTTWLDLLEQKLTRKHHHLHDVMDVSLSSKKSNKVNERWIRDIENRIKTLENTILQNNCDKKIQYLEEAVQELSKQVKQQVLYNGRTEKLGSYC